MLVNGSAGAYRTHVRKIQGSSLENGASMQALIEADQRYIEMLRIEDLISEITVVQLKEFGLARLFCNPTLNTRYKGPLTLDGKQETTTLCAICTQHHNKSRQSWMDGWFLAQ